MSHLFRFFGRQDLDGSWLIEGDEHNHLRRVLRLDVGTEVEICDGLGTVVVATLTDIGSQQAHAALVRQIPQAAPPTPIAVALGALKPQTFDDIIPDLVEIGVDVAWIFMQDKVAKARLDDKVRERWQRIARAAAKQAKQSRLLALHYADNLSQCLTQAAAQGFTSSRALDISGSPGFLAAPLKTPTLLVVGGEAGLSSAELDLLKQQNTTIFALKTGILRATTAVTLGAGIMALQRSETN
jgi:16S rRNA (uracil1498-N3)-methyltransferase